MNEEQERLILEFVNITQTEPDLARTFLSHCGWTLTEAVEQYLENPGRYLINSSDEQAMIDLTHTSSEEGQLRAPLQPKRLTLQDDVPVTISRKSRRGQRKRPQAPASTIFEALRDFRSEQQELLTPVSADNETDRRKLRTLAELFRPPFDLMVKGTLDDALKEADGTQKWLLVNVQDVAEFACQALNRDTWADQAVKRVVRAHFKLWQVSVPSPHADPYITCYPVTGYPHIAVLDPCTGERLAMWEGFLGPRELIARLTEFIKERGGYTNALHQTKNLNLSCNNNDNNNNNNPKPRRPRKLKGDQEMEDELARAIEASLHDILQNNELAASTSTVVNNTSQQSAALFPADSKSLTKQEDDTVTPESTHSGTKRKHEETHSVADDKDTNEKKRQCTTKTSEKKCILHIRTPTGEMIVGTFEAHDTLATVHRYVASQHPAGVSSTAFTFTTAFPRKTFALHDLHTITLQSAGLVPRAVLIIEDIG
jgi:thioredoxin-related protein